MISYGVYGNCKPVISFISDKITIVERNGFAVGDGGIA
jgi:hypothetical protein